MATTAEDGEALEPVERQLVDHVERGVVLDLARGRPVNDAVPQAADRTRTVSAAVIRDIVRGRLATEPDPHGLRLRGARIHGHLDLENITSTVALELVDCLLDDGVNACDANLPHLILTGCRLRHRTEPALNASRLTTTVLRLTGATVTAHDTTDGAVTLLGAHVGLLNCSGARLRNHSGPALHADRLRVDQSMFLRGGFEAVGSGGRGAVRLLDAHVGQLGCDGARLRNDSGPALHADRLRVDQSMFLRDGFEAVGSGDDGAVRLLGAHVGGQLTCSGARLRNDSGPALTADGLRVDQDMFLRGGFEAVGSGGQGAVRLLGAHVGQLECDGARLRNDSGPALHADRLSVDQSMFLRGGFEAVGSGGQGAVRLLGAHVGQLECDGARLRNDSGPALHAERLSVDRAMFLRDGFEAIGSSDKGAVRLHDAHVGGQLTCSGARLRNDSGPALTALRLRVDLVMHLHDGFEAIGAGEKVVVNLSHVRIGAALVFNPATLEHRTDPRARLNLDGLTYAGLPEGIPTSEWLHLLRTGTPGYAAQPYQHLAAAHRAAGHDGEARRILMAQRRDQLDRRALTGRAERAWARLTGITLGYGYQSWRALLGLLGVLITAVVFAVILGGHGGLAQVHDPPPATPLACTVVERVGIGLDLGTPLITTGASARCETTDTTSGQLLTITGWTLRLLAWFFATLFIAGFTSAVRKT